MNVACDLGETVCDTDGEESGGDDVIVAFNPSGPPPRTGPHRYIFLLFSQAGQPGCRIDPDEVGDQKRPALDVKKFAQTWKLGTPVKAAHYATENPVQ